MLKDLPDERKEQIYLLAALAAIISVFVTGGSQLWNWIQNYHDSLLQAGIPFPAPTLILITTIIFPSYLGLKLLERILRGGIDD